MGKISFSTKTKVMGLALFQIGLCGILGTAAVAWFVSIGSGTSDVTSIEVKNPEMVESVYFHEYYSLQTPTSGVHTFSTTGTTSLTMGKYSLLNKDYQVLMEVNLNETGSATPNLFLKAVSDATYFLGDVEDGTLVHPLEYEGNSFSSIVTFSTFAPDDVSIGTDYISVNEADRKIDATDGKDKFIDDTYQLHNAVHLTTFVNPVTKFYILIDYDPDLIAYIYSANIGNPVLSDISHIEEDGNAYIRFSSDFYFSMIGVAS